MCTGFWYENFNREYLEDIVIDAKVVVYVK
jgi:hypothetical protein